MGCGACSKKAFWRLRAAPLEPSEAEALRNDTPAVSSTCSPSRCEFSDKVLENVRFVNGCQLVCLCTDSSHEVLARHLAEEATRRLLASQRLFSVGAVVDSTRVHVSVIDGNDPNSPTCEVLVPLLTPEWLRATRSASLLRHAQRHRALNLGPELLPLLHVASFGKRPDALAHALNSPVGELLREVAAPGSWGRLENRTTPQVGVDAAAAWLVARIEALLCPLENAVHLLGKRNTQKSYRHSNPTSTPIMATPPGFGKTLTNSSQQQGHERPSSKHSYRPQHPKSQPPHRTTVDLETTELRAEEVYDEVDLTPSPKRPPGMPSLSQSFKDSTCVIGVPVTHDMTSPACLEPSDADLEDLLAAAIRERSQREPLGTNKRVPPGSLRVAAASSRPQSRPVTPAVLPTPNGNPRNSGDRQTSDADEQVRWASTTAWANFVRQECGSSGDPLRGVNVGARCVTPLAEVPLAPIPTSAGTFKLPPQPRSPPRTPGGSPIILRGHVRRAQPWRPHEGDLGNRPHSQSVGQSSGSNSAPPTPRGREEDWDHFDLRGEFCPSVTVSDAFGDISPMAPNQTFVQSEPSSPREPRETVASWNISDIGRMTLRRTCWGDTATWLQKNFGSSTTDTWLKGKHSIQEDNPWDELDEVDDYPDEFEDHRADAVEKQAYNGQKRAPLAPLGLPPLPSAQTVHRQKKRVESEVSASYKSAFGGGLRHDTEDDLPTLEGQSGRFILGDPFPTLGEEYGGKRLAFGTKYISMDRSLNRKVVVWHFQVPQGICMTEHVGIRSAIASEIGKLRQVRHPRLCPYLGCELMQGELYIVTSYAPGGSVADWLQDSGLLSEAPTRRVIQAVLEGLQHLHSNIHMAHGGIRAGNVLLGPGAAVRLADFGLASILQRRGLTSVGVTDGGEPNSLRLESWRSPELAIDASSGVYASEAGDIWAFAWLVVAMLAGFAIAAQVGSFSMDEARIPFLAEHLSPKACNVVRKCLRTSSSERPSAMLLLGDPWLAFAPQYRE
mmetsp:Transcript_119024/g.186730  ORF Transcript_119024/g.186730 Transcript_119024/m.186730 type:complete len:1010 (-) Transcript_119024:101-3130(-)